MNKHVLAVLLGAALPLLPMPDRMNESAAATVQPARERQAALPDTPAGRCAADYFRAFNSGGEEAMRAFILKYRSPSYLQSNPLEKQMIFFRSVRRMSGDLIPQSHESLSDHEVVITVRTVRRQGGLATLRFKTENADPQRLLVFTFDFGNVGTSPVDAALIESTLDSLAGILERFYVSAEMGKEMAGVLRRSKSTGRYAGATNGSNVAMKITADLRALSKDLHLGVFYGQLPKDDASPRGEPGLETNFGFSEIKVVDERVGYMKIDEFSPSEKAKEAAIKAMGALVDCEALIFDLRSCIGGGPELAHLISSFLFDGPTLLGSYYNRLEDGIKDIYTLESLPGKRFGQKKPVFILTSSLTASSAEMFAFCLQDLKRAVIIGEKTMGTAHGARHMAVNDRFWMMIPVVRPISPVSKIDWEGTGITPDIRAPEEQAFEVARKEAMLLATKRKATEAKPGKTSAPKYLLSRRGVFTVTKRLGMFLHDC